MHIYCAARLIDSVGLFTLAVLALLLITISEISYLGPVFFFRDCRSYTSRQLHLYRDTRFSHQFDQAYVSPFSKLRFFFPKRTMHTRQLSEAISFYKGNVFSRALLKLHVGASQKCLSCDCRRPKRARHV